MPQVLVPSFHGRVSEEPASNDLTLLAAHPPWTHASQGFRQNRRQEVRLDRPSPTLACASVRRSCWAGRRRARVRRCSRRRRLRWRLHGRRGWRLSCTSARQPTARFVRSMQCDAWREPAVEELSTAVLAALAVVCQAHVLLQLLLACCATVLIAAAAAAAEILLLMLFLTLRGVCCCACWCCRYQAASTVAELEIAELKSAVQERWELSPAQITAKTAIAHQRINIQSYYCPGVCNHAWPGALPCLPMTSTAICIYAPLHCAFRCILHSNLHPTQQPTFYILALCTVLSDTFHTSTTCGWGLQGPSCGTPGP